MNPERPNERDFDATMRQRHATAVAQVSAATQAQLHQRRRAALAPSRAAGLRRYGWAGAASFALLLALAVALPWQRQASSPASSGAVVASTALDGGDAGADNVLDENPDFYLWLGSADAQTLAME